MNIPLVSIIIPAYNSKLFIKETINSALQQSYKNIEIILVDDGSADGTVMYFDEFQKQGVQCFKIDNGGASNARNFGLIKAKGEYIQFLDADDLLHQNKIEKQINNMICQNADISFTPWINFSKNVNEVHKFRFDKIDYTKFRTGKELMISYGMLNWFIPTVAWLTNKSLIEKAGDWNIEISNNDDGEYFSRVLFHAKKVICINEILAYYRVTSAESLGKMNSVSKINSAFESYKLITTLVAQDSNKALLSYPKRLCYMQYISIRNDFPELAKRAAKAFDHINADSFLSRKPKYWLLIKLFGLYKGTLLYNFLIRVLKKVKTFR